MMGKKEIAEFLGVSTKSVDRLIRKGAFPIYKVGRFVKVKRSDVLNFLEAQKQTFGGESV